MNSPRFVDVDKLLVGLQGILSGLGHDLPAYSYRVGIYHGIVKAINEIGSGRFDIPSDQGEATEKGDGIDEITREKIKRRTAELLAKEYKKDSDRLREALVACEQALRILHKYEKEPSNLNEVYKQVDQALSSKGDTERLSFSGKHDFVPGINTEGEDKQ